MSSYPLGPLSCPSCGFTALPGTAYCPRCTAPLHSGYAQPQGGYGGPGTPTAAPGHPPQAPVAPAPGFGYGSGYGPPTPAGYAPGHGRPAPGYPYPYPQPYPGVPAGAGWGAPYGAPGWPYPPPPRRRHTGLIVSLVLLVVLIAAGGGVGGWWYVTTHDAKHEAANALNAAFASLSQRNAEVWCDHVYAYGENMVYESVEDCAEDMDPFDEVSTEDLRKKAASRVSASAFHEVTQGRLTLRSSDIETPQGRWTGYDEEYLSHETVVFQDVQGRGWRIIGITNGEDTVGIVPPGVKADPGDGTAV